jgi:two-component system sensor histidine kinase KdpD
MTRGTLRIYLGAAPGVGKTFAMLGEGRRRAERGTDVVVGFVETYGRPLTAAQLADLPVIGRRVITHDGVEYEEMDLDAILARRPQVALVDELAHSNAPGSRHARRWEDVEVLLDAGIDVLTTMNVQHVESLYDQIWQSTGVRVRETVPDWVVKEADEVVMVDLTPRALLNRLERGVVYPPDRARAALQNFFREPTLVALRELAMRQTAYTVESRHHFEDQAPAAPIADMAAAGPRERLLLLIEPDPASAALIRRGRRMADYLQADCVAVYVSKTADLRQLNDEERDRLQRHLNFAQALQIRTHVLEGEDMAESLVAFARQQKVTQIFIARQKERTLQTWFTEGFVQQIVNLAHDMQVTVVADRSVCRRG